jgi:Lon protease-like protein
VELAPKYPVPVFPLPDFVLFPCAIVPLHVFERRYRALVRDLLRSDHRLIALALLKPGWERDYQGSPAFHPTGCLARVESVTWNPDDCYDLWVTGLSRVRFGEVRREYPYRAANVALIPQEPLSDDDPLIQMERQSLDEAYGRIPGSGGGSGFPSVPPAGEGAGPPSFEAFVNTICAELALDAAAKLQLLELDSVLERSRRVREWIEQSLRGPRKREGGEHN